MELTKEILSLIENNEVDEAIVALTSIVESGSADAEVYFERGKLYWKKGLMRKAINDYTKSESLDPTGPASQALRQAMTIMDFYDKNRYNP